jgi:cytochrome c-type biogenesis protein CcmE
MAESTRPSKSAEVEPHSLAARPREAQPQAAATRRWVGPAIASGLAMVAAAIAGLVLTGMQDNAIYSKPVDELLAQRAKFAGRPVRAEGILTHGSLVKRDQPCEYRFTINKNGAELPVRFAQCVVPDTFRDVPDLDVGVTVEGELQADGSFEATSVLAKCPSKYEMKQRKDHGEQMPHGPFAEGAMGPSAEGQAAATP